MAHFRGTVQGGRTEASRLGHKGTGITVQAQSWQGKVVVYLSHDEKTGKDIAEVVLSSHHGGGVEQPRVLFRGPVDGSEVTK